MRRLLYLAALLSAPAFAQSTPHQDASIVVTGQRTTDTEVADFVDAFGVAPQGKQLSRFEFAVCPAVTGVLPEQKALVVARIRAVAKAAHIRVAGEKCAPNVVVIVTPHRAELVDALLRKQPAYFDGLSRRQIRDLRDSPASAVAWHIAGPQVGADGEQLDVDPDGGFSVNRTVTAGSRISFATRPQFAAGIVAVDARVLDGLTAIQLADYAAMRTLIATDPTLLDKSSAPTILKVLDAAPDSQVPASLTDWDLSVLRALYDSSPTVSGKSQRSDMRTRVQKDLKKRD